MKLCDNGGMDEQQSPVKPLGAGRLFLKATGLSLLIVLVMLFITALVAAGFAYHKFTVFLKNAGVGRPEFIQTVKTGWSQSVTQTDGHINILLMGVDTLATRGDSLPLTDTMMIVSVNTNTGTINMLPFPRDLWHIDYKTRINALYAYGIDRFPGEPQRFPKETLEQMTGIPIHHTIVLSMDQVAKIIDIMGGVEVDVKQGFTDSEFPRTDVDVTKEHDPKKLYETITFEPGKQIMSGERALKFMRSRHSGDLSTGTDNARSERQQQVIMALVGKMRQRDTLLNPELMGKLYRYYLDTFAKSIGPEEGLAILKALLPVRNSIQLTQHELSIFPDDPHGLIEHPLPSKYAGQWVYIVHNPDTFKESVQKILGSK